MIRRANFAAVSTLAFSTAAGAKCPDRKPVRPKAFEPFSTLLLGAKGFAMYGCFPGGAALGNGEPGQPPAKGRYETPRLEVRVVEEGGGWRPDPESGPVDWADGAP